MPILVLLLVGVALFMALSSVRGQRTADQRRAALRSVSDQQGGEVSEYADGGELKFHLAGWPAQLRVYALPKEPLGVSTEILLEMGEALAVPCEILGDRILPAFRRAVGLPEKPARFEDLFRESTPSPTFFDPEVRQALLDLWQLGPPKHTRLCGRDGVLMLSKDHDFCRQDQLKAFLRIAETLAGRLALKSR